MYYTDFHIHCNVSPDARDVMSDMANAAAANGMDCVCFTDHFDLDNFRTGQPNYEWFDRWAEELTQYRETLASSPVNDVRLGMELGEANHRPEDACRVSEVPELDFVLGSLHNLRLTQDFYDLPYESEEHCMGLLDRYLDELLELAGLDFIDSVAHIGYTRRYMHRAGFKAQITPETHGDRLEAIFKTLIRKGTALEINCSGLRDANLRETAPSLPLLAFYRSLGGELVTVGSDAHRVKDAGVMVKEGYDILKTLGFKYVTVFKHRKPEFITL